MGVPVMRMRFVPSGNTLTPSAIRCSSSSAGSFAFCAQRAGVVEEGDLCQKWECSFQLSWHRRRGRAHDAQLVMGFRVHAEALPHFTIVCHVRFPLRAKAASHPWGHTHMRPSRSVSNNYHATNHQPIRNKGAKKKRRATVQNGGRAADARALPRLRGIWGIRFACRMTTGQNSSSNEALLCMASV